MELVVNLPKPLGFDGRFIHYPIHIDGLPQEVVFRDQKLLLKDEFHCSLICTYKLSQDQSLNEQELLNAFGKLATEYPLGFGGYKPELRFVQRDDRKSIVIMCEIDGLKNIFTRIQKQVHADIPMQPTHVTLYTLQFNAGIGISSERDIGNITERLDGEEGSLLKKRLNFDTVFGRASHG